MEAIDRDRRPGWLEPIAQRVQQRGLCEDRGPDAHTVLRPAAVLVVLIDSPDGPQLLLTERSPALTNYPGTLVFPGGAVEAGDDGPVATALREAAEEIRVDPDSVHVIGLLPPVALRPAAFLVIAVVGWCARLELTGPVNSDEVAAVVQVPLHEFADGSGRVQRVETKGSTSPSFLVDGIAVGSMTATVIELLIDTR